MLIVVCIKQVPDTINLIREWACLTFNIRMIFLRRSQV